MVNCNRVVKLTELISRYSVTAAVAQTTVAIVNNHCCSGQIIYTYTSKQDNFNKELDGKMSFRCSPKLPFKHLQFKSRART